MADRLPVNSSLKMENWSYILREWWARHGRDVKRYGICALLVIMGMHRGPLLAAWVGLFAAFCMFAYDRYDGEGWRQRGARVLGQDKNPPQNPS